ncbi:MAG: glycosyltransferase family protein [Butyribacter sp.]|nr:glycosyltransferase family protein [bacterium]MDY3853691.1 glycosyltransferase family protein [Butyribacter sp.]
MNPNEFCFIICSNNETYLSECLLYLNQLNVPAGYSTDVITIGQASSLAAGYQAGMKASNAKYKIYLHQDVFILNRNFLSDTLHLFEKNPDIGMLGMVGTKKLPKSGIMWDTKQRVGALRSCSLNTVDDFFDIPVLPESDYETVEAIDGLLMMTQYDIDWREDLFTGWDFYDVSQSFEFRRQGYRVAVPYQETPWVLHDCGFLNLSAYDTSRDIFLKEYAAEL